MQSALILINTETGKDDEVCRTIRKIPGVKEVYTVYGLFDIVVKAEAESTSALQEIVFNKN